VSESDAVRFTLLGQVGAERDSRPLPVGTPQQRALLVALLLRPGQVVGLDDIVTAVWGPAPPSGAGGMVRTYVSRLRRALGTVDIANTAGGYAIAVPPDRIDLIVYRDLLTRARSLWRSGRSADALPLFRTARALWRGVPLAGVPGPYAAAQRTMLRNLRFAGDLDGLAAELELPAHDPRPALAQLQTLVARYPMLERPRELLMLSLARAGRPAEALAAFADGRDLLADRLGVDPGPGLVRARRKIEARAAGAGPVPAQLPRDLMDFSGRGPLLHALCDALRGGATGLYGPADLGKSAIAVHAGHRLRAAYPDGQLYADLAIADADAVLVQFLRAQGLAANDIPDDRGERIRLWRHCLDGRRQLVVLDNARGAEQVRPLLFRAAGSATIVTGRRRLNVPAVHWLTVPPLSAEEGVALLDRIVGDGRIRAEPEAAWHLAVAAGGNPRRLRMIAARLASRPSWTVAAVNAASIRSRHRCGSL